MPAGDPAVASGQSRGLAHSDILGKTMERPVHELKQHKRIIGRTGGARLSPIGRQRKRRTFYLIVSVLLVELTQPRRRGHGVGARPARVWSSPSPMPRISARAAATARRTGPTWSAQPASRCSSSWPRLSRSSRRSPPDSSVVPEGGSGIPQVLSSLSRRICRTPPPLVEGENAFPPMPRFPRRG